MGGQALAAAIADRGRLLYTASDIIPATAIFPAREGFSYPGDRGYTPFLGVADREERMKIFFGVPPARSSQTEDADVGRPIRQPGRRTSTILAALAGLTAFFVSTAVTVAI
jgi:hypothetical protein